jgi:HEAT repeat protein
MRTKLQLNGWIKAVAAVVLLSPASFVYAAGELPARKSEAELIKILQSGQKPEQALACKELAICGTKECVPELGKLLKDKELSSWARLALEAIPEPACDDVLIVAARDLKGNRQVGAINSLGVRKSEKAIELLAESLADTNKQVASAAAVALGRIGNDEATKSLRGSLTNTKGSVRSAVAEGCILCAERLTKDGKRAEAAALYEEVRKAEPPKQRQLEAMRGEILARGKSGLPLLMEQLRSSDDAFFRIGLMTARQLPGRDVTDAIAAELAKSEPARAIGLLAVLADRADGGIPSAVIRAARNGDKKLRVAAIGVIGRLGDGASVPTLLEIAAESDDEVSQAAAAALATVPGENVDSALVSNMSKADGKALAALIQAVGAKGIDATPALMKTLNNSDTMVRQASFTALGDTVKPRDLHFLIGQYVNGKNAADNDIAGKALRAACIRMPNREACAAELAGAMKQASSDENVFLVEILADMGGPKALATIGAAAKGKDANVQDMATKALGKWMTVDAEPVLLELAKAESGCKYPDRALRGYIRLARQFTMPDEKRAQICATALEVAKRDSDKKLVLEAIQRHPSREGLKLAVKAAKLPGIAEDARKTSLVIGPRIITDRSELRETLAQAGVKPVKIEIVKAHYGSNSNKRDVTQVLQKDAGEFPVINLHASSYNKTFGGDPAPNEPKQLIVQYRINGKSGDATFAENDVIMLPMPQ